jgi:hypothetical protein
VCHVPFLITQSPKSWYTLKHVNNQALLYQLIFRITESVQWEPSSCMRHYRRTDSQTDMTRLKIAFRKFSKVPKNSWKELLIFLCSVGDNCCKSHAVSAEVVAWFYTTLPRKYRDSTWNSVTTAPFHVFLNPLLIFYDIISALLIVSLYKHR